MFVNFFLAFDSLVKNNQEENQSIDDTSVHFSIQQPFVEVCYREMSE